MEKTVEFIVKNSKPFTSYLKKFASIDSTVLFEVNLEKSQFITKSPNEERSIVKYGVLPFNEANFEIKSNLKILIKVGIYNISRLIKIIEQFGDEFKFIIKFDEIIVNDGKDYAALSILIKNSALKFNNECTSLNIFKYISDDLYKSTIRKVESIISFNFTKENIERVRALCELDKEYKFIEFINKNGNLYAKGKSFEYLIAPTTNVDAKISFYKDQFDKVDIENCDVIMGSDRMLFSSIDTVTEIVVSRVERDDNYEEKIEDPFN